MKINDRTIVVKDVEFDGIKVSFEKNDETAFLSLVDKEKTSHAIYEGDVSKLKELARFFSLISQMIEDTPKPRKPRTPKVKKVTTNEGS